MVKRAVSGIVAVAALVLAGLVTTAPGAGATGPASAPAAALACNPGDACIVDSHGQVVYANDWNTGPIWVEPSGGGYVWNNGVRSPGLDHIQVFTQAGTARADPRLRLPVAGRRRPAGPRRAPCRASSRRATDAVRGVARGSVLSSDDGSPGQGCRSRGGRQPHPPREPPG